MLQLLYIGLDIATAMQRKAKTLLEDAVEEGLLANGSKVITMASWSRLGKLPQTLARKRDVIFNATYLFSSDSLDVDDVRNAVMGFKESQNVRRLLFVYSNTPTSVSNRKFHAFKEQLEDEFTTDGLARTEASYHKKRHSEAAESMTFVHELLDFKGSA